MGSSGIKADLVKRLFEYYQEKAAGEEKEEVMDQDSNQNEEENKEVSESVEGEANQPARLSLQFSPPKAHPAGPPPEDSKHSKSGPVPLMSLEVAPPTDLQAEEKPQEVVATPQVLQLPRALEEALAYKSERAEEMGVGPDTVASFSHMEKKSPTKPVIAPPGAKPQLVAEDDDDESDKKGKQKKKQKKKKKKNRPEMWARQAVEA